MVKNKQKIPNYENTIKKILQDNIDTINDSFIDFSKITYTIDIITEAISNGNKIILFGNGGSAADAQHIAGELVGRFQKNRKSYSAIALSTDTSIITAIANDFSYDEIFSRQCEALVSTGDVVIGISTSGNSKNVLKAITTSKKLGATTIGLFGNKGKIKNLVDIPLMVKSNSTPRIQEIHRIIYHIICQLVEENLEK
jgi:D-sedoheptulose 7-phosphate isomerase